MLDVKNVEKSFGDLRVLYDCSLHVEAGTVRGLIGPNGAGKTTLLNLIGGFYKPDRGSIHFKNERIDHLKVHDVARRGIGRTFQITRLFSDMTLMDNVLTAGLAHYKSKEELESKAASILRFFNLFEKSSNLASEISGGQKKLLEMARALIFEPDLLLLDEPFHGIHPDFKKQITDFICKLSEEGKTFIVVSHDVPSVVNTCDSISVLSAGEVIAEGTGEEIRRDERVIEAYLGV